MVPFKYAKLSKGKRWFVSYYYTHPLTNELVRKRIYVDHIHPTSLKKRYAAILIQSINAKLEQGWTPLADFNSSGQVLPMMEATKRFMTWVEKVKRPTTIFTYRGHIKRLTTYLEEQKMELISVQGFTSFHARQFMDGLAHLAPNTINSTLLGIKAFYSWMRERGYATTNPFADIKLHKVPPKKRQPLTREQQHLLSHHLRANDFPMYVATSFLFYTGTRPHTLTHLKVADIDLEKDLIHVAAAADKSKKGRLIPVVAPLKSLLSKYMRGLPADKYLWSTGIKPGDRKVQRGQISDKFTQHRRDLGLPDSITLYSIKDTVAARMDEAGVPVRMIRDFFAHSNIKTTDIYMRNFKSQVDPSLFDQVDMF